MFNKNSPTALKTGSAEDHYRQKIQISSTQRPLTNMLHKRNSSSVCNNESLLLNNSASLDPSKLAANRMMSPPAKQQVGAT